MSDETLFHEARQKPIGERTAFLQEACGGDDALRERLESLLQADDNPDSLLEPKLPATSAFLPSAGGRSGARALQTLGANRRRGHGCGLHGRAAKTCSAAVWHSRSLKPGVDTRPGDCAV